MKKALFILLLAAATGCHKKSEFVAPEPEGDRVAVGFALGGVSVSAKPASRADAPVAEELAVGTTVRVLAFQRAAGAVSADITADKFVAEATYVVVENTKDDGTKVRVLEACNVNPATGAVDNANTADPAQIRLRADKYDFYALTPATAIASPWEVSVNHGVDHASCVVTDVAIAPNTSRPDPYKQEVDLGMLMRKCAKVSFVFKRKSESSSIKKIEIKKVKLSKIAHSPATAKLCEALSIGANDGSYDGFPVGVYTFPDTGDPTTFACFDEVLPKSSASYQLEVTANFNDSKDDTDLTPASITTDKAEYQDVLAFQPNKHYIFTITLKGNSFTLTLDVGDWNLADDWDNSSVGGWPEASVEVGQWDVVESWDTDMGGNTFPPIGVGDWTSSFNWNLDLGVE